MAHKSMALRIFLNAHKNKKNKKLQYQELNNLTEDNSDIILINQWTKTEFFCWP